MPTGQVRLQLFDNVHDNSPEKPAIQWRIVGALSNFTHRLVPLPGACESIQKGRPVLLAGSTLYKDLLSPLNVSRFLGQTLTACNFAIRKAEIAPKTVTSEIIDRRTFKNARLFSSSFCRGRPAKRCRKFASTIHK